MGFEFLAGGDDGLKLCGVLIGVRSMMAGGEGELASLEVLVVVGQCLELLLWGGHYEGCAGLKPWKR